MHDAHKFRSVHLIYSGGSVCDRLFLELHPTFYSNDDQRRE